MLGFEPHCAVNGCRSKDSTDAEYFQVRLQALTLSIPFCKRHGRRLTAQVFSPHRRELVDYDHTEGPGPLTHWLED